MSRIVFFILTIASTLVALQQQVEGLKKYGEEGSVQGGGSIAVKTTPDYSAIKSTDAPSQHKEKDKWLIYVSAGPTVFIFIICVIAISVKNCSDGEGKESEGRSVLNQTAAPAQPVSPMALLKPNEISLSALRPPTKAGKPKIINEVYDKMLEQFKDDKNKNKNFVGRKCSQIQIQGVESGSPKSLARKHLIIGKLTGNPSIKNESERLSKCEEVEENPIAALVARSTTTFIGGPLLHSVGKNESKDTEDSVEITNTVKEILRTSIEDLTVADRRTYCDELDELLLPEDLEEAFNNFEYWQESDI